MNVVCLDMEGVIYPEIWIAFSEESGIPELRRTTRDEPDYDKLMKWRMGILREHGLKLKDVQNTIAKIRPLPGAKEFLDELRSITQVIILSDTFSQFAQPLMEQLGWPTIFCNELIIDDEGYIADMKMRCDHSKLTTVRGLQAIGFDTIAAGDSYNDLEMIEASKAGFLFRSTEKIKADYPQGLALIVCAGMNYAAYVENIHHRDVLTSAELVAESLAEKLLKGKYKKV